jgi:hypothetical protein
MDLKARPYINKLQREVFSWGEHTPFSRWEALCVICTIPRSLQVSELQTLKSDAPMIAFVLLCAQGDRWGTSRLATIDWDLGYCDIRGLLCVSYSTLGALWSTILKKYSVHSEEFDRHGTALIEEPVTVTAGYKWLLQTLDTVWKTSGWQGNNHTFAHQSTSWASGNVKKHEIRRNWPIYIKTLSQSIFMEGTLLLLFCFLTSFICS